MRTAVTAKTLFLVLLTMSDAGAQAPLGSAWTYQGLLEDAGGPVTGQVDMIFTLYNAVTMGDVVGTAFVFDGQFGNDPPVEVAEGLFTVRPDFGANVFDGTALFLQIQVRSPHDPSDTGLYTTLDPRQPITATPIALQTRGMFVEEPSGNVGIGTTTPATTLDVEGRATVDASGTGQAAVTVVGGIGEAAIQIDNETGLWRIWTLNGYLNFTQIPGATNTPFRIHEDAEGMSLDVNPANVLVGTDLVVTGEVGIGTTVPDEALDVVGNVHASGTIASGASITIDGLTDQIRSTADLELHLGSGRALRLEDNGLGVAPNVIAGDVSNSVAAGVAEATISGGITNSVTANLGTIGGGVSHIVSGEGATVAGGLNNEASDLYATVAGGTDNIASGSQSFIGGGTANTSDGPRSAIGGGNSNAASGEWSFIGGGIDNEAVGNVSTIAGGTTNMATAGSATVAGGSNNLASGSTAAISGGSFNTASGDLSALGGGTFNTASGFYATVPGGRDNVAQGDYSFAAGRRAKSLHEGTFVWADGTNADFASLGSNQFNVRASGGTHILSNTGATVGVQLPAGSNSWSSISDRDLKENFTSVDPREVLQKLARVPVTQWNLRSQDPSIQHIGPMAQDFHAAFGLGECDRYISGSDADGVALTAIKGLYEMVNDKEREIAALRSEMEERIAALEKTLTELRADFQK